jgi:two-component system, OmpR family, sensor histidine kinase MtrB
MSLRRSSLVFAAVLAVIGAAVAIALIVLTANLHRATQAISAEVESLRIGEELELGLLALREQAEPDARAAGEQRVRFRLAEAASYMRSQEEQVLFGSLQRGVDQYIAALDRAAPRESLAQVQADTRATFEPAFASARQWMALNVKQGRAAERAAERWGELADDIGVAAILLLVVGLGGLAWWLQRRTFRPALDLARAIERYARGDRTARASEQKPEEFRTIARCFNHMARILDRQRADQIAFLAGVAHDIRNPLGALKMATEMIRPDEPLPPEPRLRQLVARIDRQIGRLERMVHDFLDASRIESGNLELQLKDSDVRELARATLDLFEPAAPTHPLEFHAPDGPVRARCDPMRIEQVLANLVNNAIKYSPPGGAIQVAVAARPDGVLVSVADEGEGMEPDEIERVFDPFRRGGEAVPAVPGAGLGLFVARRIAEAHGGTLTVESMRGVGSTFTLRLAADPPPDAGAGGPDRKPGERT